VAGVLDGWLGQSEVLHLADGGTASPVDAHYQEVFCNSFCYNALASTDRFRMIGSMDGGYAGWGRLEQRKGPYIVMVERSASGWSPLIENPPNSFARTD
jgi:hypothetical protein